MSKRKFMMPMALSLAALLSTASVEASTDLPSTQSVQEDVTSKVNSGLQTPVLDGFVLKKSLEAQKFAGHYSHRSHSSHSSHYSHRSHYSSSY